MERFGSQRKVRRRSGIGRFGKSRNMWRRFRRNGSRKGGRERRGRMSSIRSRDCRSERRKTSKDKIKVGVKHGNSFVRRKFGEAKDIRMEESKVGRKSTRNPIEKILFSGRARRGIRLNHVLDELANGLEFDAIDKLVG